ncbi:hypothetical protein HMPREF0819_1322 [Streptococcus equinus ATCC 9812]|uniref:Uncharacterized protein n=1 Tax=Streptococcus equinus ATCC 9812 TaxID=525379 RepID=E8JQQ2_STREI|nr:hypothetical protein HMPREF0819_1322 [Streptococcus equinus ATCC 9812]
MKLKIKIHQSYDIVNVLLHKIVIVRFFNMNLERILKKLETENTF